MICLISLALYAAFAVFVCEDVGKQVGKANFIYVKNQPGRAFSANSSNGENIGTKGFYSNAEDRSLTWDMKHPDLSVLRPLFCGKLSEKYVVSSDGTVWMYGENYLISFDGGLPALAVRSVRGMIKGETQDLHALMSSKELFCSTAAFEVEPLGSVPGLSARVFHGTKERRCDIFCVTADGFSSPVLYDFSLFFENREF